MKKDLKLCFKLTVLCLMGALVLSCDSETNDIDLSSIGGGGGGGSTAAPLLLQVYTQYQGSATEDYHTFNETLTTSCEADSGSPSVTCTVDIPENQLYLSYTHFAITYSNECSTMVFRPYRYLASVSATYTPPGETSAIDCSGTPLAGCYGGPAADIVPSFPSYTAIFDTPSDIYTSVTYTAQPGNVVQTGSNRYVASDLLAANVANTYTSGDLGGAGDGYEPNSFRDYTVSCEDPFGTDLYDITLVITESDGAVNDFFSFKEQP